ncbi:MAG: 2,3-bisphosphoglycerate-independent phosphoglycerate mutase [Gammaproteobacteria bacterium]|nr:2,3-bisphosphoglycerate-independent phosphoglycerate mutase [Gammaproteobacteria bacterium]MYF29304.1 2,3-bisphosphoglycerate-independent phosphoglycerate mutase [Gammaproteobacteria bacterium]MYK46884.1 2,3-bisphosphoglycerate-independent phosphoglycerate mutase [Gammaproteobacteria bacterium]
MSNPPTTLLVVLDGWGVSSGGDDDAIHRARTPTWDRLWESASSTTLSASGTSVGLPDGQMGNSEVGHMNLGAGRTVYQDLTRIDRAVADGSFADNPVVRAAIAATLEHASTLHVFGLLSPGGVHSHEDHLARFVELSLARGARTRLHAFLDGRDVPPKSAMETLAGFEERFPGVVASIIGRYYGMDRDARWERTERAYRLIAAGDAPRRLGTPTQALEAAYARGETDEFVQPTAIRAAAAPPLRIHDGDVGMFMNFRADRARQLVRALTAEHFDEFARPVRPAFAMFATLTRYSDDIELPAAFAPVDLTDTVGACWAAADMSQLRIAETEKYAHVTYFFSGGREQPFPREERILVPSPNVATYDLAPAMSAREVTDHLVGAIESGRFDAIVCNFANGDMVGHTGVLDAAVTAVEVIDECLARVVEALRRTSSQCLVTADHGNVERLVDRETNQPHTAHTSGPVPLVYVGPRKVRLVGGGTLADVAPTLLDLMDLGRPAAMTGRSLLDTAVEGALAAAR